MKILFLISSFDGGGAARIVSNISLRLPETWTLDILLNSDETINYPYKGNILSLGLDVHKDRGSILYKIKTLFVRIKKLKQIRNDYDCCISYMDSANIANILSGKKGQCKTIINVVNNMTASAKNSPAFRIIVNPLIKLFYNKADGIIALSEEVKKDLIDNYGLNGDLIRVSYCSIDVNRIKEIINSFDEELDEEWWNKKFTVVTAGRFDKQKGQWHLIRAFSEVVKHFPQAKLVIFGEGSLEGYYRELISDYGLENNICIRGYDQRLTAYISHSAIFAFPSVFEGFGTALQEALMCDVACVATDYESGAREQLDPDYVGIIDGMHEGEYGILTKPCDVRLLKSKEELDNSEICLSNTLIQLIDDDDLRTLYAKKAKERGVIFDVNAIAEKWINDVKSMCAS